MLICYLKQSNIEMTVSELEARLTTFILRRHELHVNVTSSFAVEEVQPFTFELIILTLCAHSPRIVLRKSLPTRRLVEVATSHLTSVRATHDSRSLAVRSTLSGNTLLLLDQGLEEVDSTSSLKLFGWVTST